MGIVAARFVTANESCDLSVRQVAPYHRMALYASSDITVCQSVPCHRKAFMRQAAPCNRKALHASSELPCVKQHHVAVWWCNSRQTKLLSANHCHNVNDGAACGKRKHSSPRSALITILCQLSLCALSLVVCPRAAYQRRSAQRRGYMCLADLAVLQPHRYRYAL